MAPRSLILIALLARIASSQLACENYGSTNGSSCACPPGFGGATCSDPGCGGDIFQGTQRALAQPAGGAAYANLTAAGCACESGWTGTGCNVCQSASACQAALAASGHSQSAQSSVSGVQDGQNATLTCSTTSRVFAGGQMSCQVINPTLQVVYSGATTLNILRTLQPSLTPVPNVTAFGVNGSIYAQLWYNGVEQFFCNADSCIQDMGDGSGGSDWTCQDLACTCRKGSTFCGAVPTTDLTNTINGLSGTLEISCQAPANGSSTSACSFKQSVLQSLFGPDGLALSGCIFGECVAQGVIDTAANSDTSSAGGGGKALSGGVVAGLAVIGALLALALLFLALGCVRQRRARRAPATLERSGGVAVEWAGVSYAVPGAAGGGLFRRRARRSGFSDEKVILDSVSGRVEPGQMMAVLGPSGAGKTTLVEILAGKRKAGHVSGRVSFPARAGAPTRAPRVALVPQQDVLPPALTVREALLFAAHLRLPEAVREAEKAARVERVMVQLGIAGIADTRIGSGERRGVSGGEMRRVSIGLELVGRPDVLVLDEPTSGLDSVSAAKVASVLHAVAHDEDNPTAVIASIHQPSSKLYHTFDQLLVLSHGRSLFSGPGGLSPAAHFAAQGVPAPPAGYNIADYLLEVASDPPPALFQTRAAQSTSSDALATDGDPYVGLEKLGSASPERASSGELEEGAGAKGGGAGAGPAKGASGYATTFLTQFEVLAGREWKILRRDKTLFLTHVGVACVLGVFCGGLYFKTNDTIAGFQSRVGCLFFLGALIAFSSLSALYNVVEIRPLFLRERSNSYYSPTAWLLSRLIFDVIPLRIIPTIIVSSITYWMAGLAHEVAHFFKFLFILVLYSLTMTLFNFLLACVFRNGGVAILLSALTALYQMTFAGFFVHLNSIPPVLRWLQWLCPLKYALEALSVNEVGAGLMIQDTLQGVPVDVSASLIMQLLFGFGLNNYYRDVLVQFAFIAGFGLSVIGAVWFNVRERR